MSNKRVYKVLLGEIVVDTEMCIGCGDCVDACPSDALTMKAFSDKEMPVVECPMECLLCRACETTCVLNALRIMMEG